MNFEKVEVEVKSYIITHQWIQFHFLFNIFLIFYFEYIILWYKSSGTLWCINVI